MGFLAFTASSLPSFTSLFSLIITCISARRSKKWQFITVSSPLCFPRMFFHSFCAFSSSFCPVFWCVLVIDILANGCISFSRRFVRVSPHIISVYTQPVLLHSLPSLLLMGSMVTLESPRPIRLVHVCTITRSPPCRRLLFILLSRSLFYSHPQSSLPVTIFYHLVCCSHASRDQCTSIYVPEQHLFA